VIEAIEKDFNAIFGLQKVVQNQEMAKTPSPTAQETPVLPVPASCGHEDKSNGM